MSAYLNPYDERPMSDARRNRYLFQIRENAEAAAERALFDDPARILVPARDGEVAETAADILFDAMSLPHERMVMLARLIADAALGMDVQLRAKTLLSIPVKHHGQRMVRAAEREME